MAEKVKPAEELRQSKRLRRGFWVSEDDMSFDIPFLGHDVNLTGLSFWLESAEHFLPGQRINLWLRNAVSDETYNLEAVEVISVRQVGDLYLCGCHIAQVGSEQLLAHSRLLSSQNQKAKEVSIDSFNEFNLVSPLNQLTQDLSEIEDAAMALDLAMVQWSEQHRIGDFLLKDLKSVISLVEPDLVESIEHFCDFYASSQNQSLALLTLAKLLIHSPDSPNEKLEWQGFLADFEARYVNKTLQIAYDYMHQGMSAEEALLQSKQDLEDKLA
ncbi:MULTISPECIES: PilZ domain-containing protein [Thiomicrorhabdus]|uniref:PilZ domain-containing protein n=1 Tax=Thiomicrorhabdus heinhorstiae TaxID=2748010 RepID=A0ABS0BZH9_9GAMM|nr:MULTISPECIES: PilZ domain-containing protein [Thiomicrorhabdus]MBF6058266.1 PilZ domain-containing protein [Thiomicrorhabdus heinhorstiae]